MDKLENLDKEIEYIVHNLRGGVEDFLGIRKRTAERILGTLATSIDIYTFSSKYIAAIMIIYHIFLLYVLPEQKSSPQSNGGVKVQKENLFSIRLRLGIGCLFLYYLIDGKFISLTPLMYICHHLHDNDDRGIKNWAKGQLKKLKSSVKIPESQPLPV